MAHPWYALVFAPAESDDHTDPYAGDLARAPTTAVLSSADAECVARIRSGNQDALGGLFHAYYPALVAYAESYLGVRADAEEEVADLFEWIWAHRATWTVNASGIRAYLYRSVRNRVLNRVRHRRRAHARYLQLAREGHEGVVPVASSDAGEQIVANETADAFTAALTAVLAQLTPGVREVVSLRANDGLSFDEIAAATETSVAAVRMQWSRGLKLLRQELPRLLSEFRP